MARDTPDCVCLDGVVPPWGMVFLTWSSRQASCCLLYVYISWSLGLDESNQVRVAAAAAGNDIFAVPGRMSSPTAKVGT